MDFIPRLKFNRVKKERATTVSGWKVTKTINKSKGTVRLVIYNPYGRVRFYLQMTLDEWKEFKK